MKIILISILIVLLIQLCNAQFGSMWPTGTGGRSGGPFYNNGRENQRDYLPNNGRYNNMGPGYGYGFLPGTY
ncbi:hypothetical protein ACFW04_002619 [Cataglyphis niger]